MKAVSRPRLDFQLPSTAPSCCRGLSETCDRWRRRPVRLVPKRPSIYPSHRFITTVLLKTSALLLPNQLSRSRSSCWPPFISQLKAEKAALIAHAPARMAEEYLVFHRQMLLPCVVECSDCQWPQQAM